MFELFLQPENWASLATLTILEIVLGVDNLIFLSILASRLPAHQQKLGRRLGLGAAVVTRLALLASAAWIVTLTHPVFDFGEYEISWRDLLLLAGGLFLMAKATIEIHHAVEGDNHATSGKEAVAAKLRAETATLLEIE